MNKQPLVSIITPCYNSQEYIQRYIDFILKQTYNNIQLIFINDGSTDDTEKIIKANIDKIKSRGFEIDYIYQENKGLGGAINTGLANVRGEYFAWCDSDNFYTEDYVEKKVDFFLENPQYSIVRCDGYIVNDSDILNPVATMADKSPERFNEKLFENAVLTKKFHFGCAMIKTADFDKINPERYIYPSREGQNWQLLLPMFYNYKSGYIDRPMFYFVVRANSISNIARNKGAQYKLAQNNEYVNILTKAIESISNMPEEERKSWILKVENKYLMKNLVLARAGKDKKLEKSISKEMKNRGIYTYKCARIYTEFSKMLSFVKRVYFHIKRKG